MTPGPLGGIEPGPGEPAPPGGRPRVKASAPRPFEEPILAWVKVGLARWWRVALTPLPVDPDERRKAHMRIRNGWKREIDRQKAAGHVPADADLTTRFVQEDGTDYFTWGPFTASESE